MQPMAVELSSLSDTFMSGCCMGRSCGINPAFDDVSIRQNSLQLRAWPDGALPPPPNEPSWRSGPGCFRSGLFPSLATEVGPPCAPSRRSASHARLALFDLINQDPSGRKRNVGAEL